MMKWKVECKLVDHYKSIYYRVWYKKAGQRGHALTKWTLITRHIYTIAYHRKNNTETPVKILILKQIFTESSELSLEALCPGSIHHMQFCCSLHTNSLRALLLTPIKDIFVLGNGEVMESGSHAQLITKPNSFYAEMWAEQNTSLEDSRQWTDLEDSQQDNDQWK